MCDEDNTKKGYEDFYKLKNMVNVYEPKATNREQRRKLEGLQRQIDKHKKTSK